MSLRQLKFKPNVRSANKNQQDDGCKDTPPVNVPVLSSEGLDKAVSKKDESISQNADIQDPAKKTNVEIKSSKCTEKVCVNEEVKPPQKTRRKPNVKPKAKNCNDKEIDKTISSCDILKSSSFDIDEQEKCNITSLKSGEKADNYDSNLIGNPISDKSKGSEIVILQKRIVQLKSALKILHSQGSECKTLENSSYAHKDQLFELSTLENKAPEKTNPQSLGKHVLPIQTLNSKPTFSSLKERTHRSSEINKFSNSLTAPHLSKVQLCSSRTHDLNIEEACSDSDLYNHKNALKFSPKKKLLICADKKNATPENVSKENTFPVCENDSTSLKHDSSEIANNCSDASKKRETLIGKNNNAVYGSKSLRACQIAGPFKPKLTNRSSRLVASSSFGKMGSEVRQQLAKKLKDSSPESAKLTMLDLIFYNPTTNPMPHGGLSDTKNEAETQDQQSEVCTKEISNISSGDENSQTEKEPIECDLTPVPQLRISGDGKVILSQDSLTVDQSKGELSHDIEYLFDTPEKKNKKKTKKNEGHRWAWSYDDTVKFYVALNTVGSDFELMKAAFPDRSRSNLKSKFKREEKTHGSLIDKVMSHPSEFNLKDVLEELETEKKFEETLMPSCGKRKRGQNIKNARKKHHLLNITPWGKEKIEGLTIGQVKKMFNEDLLNENTGKSKDPLPLQNKPIENCSDKQDSDNQNKNDDSNLTKRKGINPEACEPPRKRRVMRKPKKYHCTVENDEIKEQEFEKTPESKNIVINTKIDYGPLKVTQYIKLDLNNIDNPVELNETIAHDHNCLVDNKQVGTAS